MVTVVRFSKNMKKAIAGIILALVSICAVYAQKDVTQFLGIPIDGSKSAMIQKLKAKGFKANSYNKDVLEGEFNGMDVNVHVATNGVSYYGMRRQSCRRTLHTDSFQQPMSSVWEES